MAVVNHLFVPDPTSRLHIIAALPYDVYSRSKTGNFGAFIILKTTRDNFSDDASTMMQGIYEGGELLQEMIEQGIWW